MATLKTNQFDLEWHYKNKASVMSHDKAYSFVHLPKFRKMKISIKY